MAHAQRLSFAYRLTANTSSFKFTLQCLIAVPSLDSVTSLTWELMWSGQSHGYSDEWRQVKIPMPADAVALKFEMSGAEVSIGHIRVTPFASAPYAFIEAGDGHSCALHFSVGQVRCWGRGIGLGHGMPQYQTAGDDDWVNFYVGDGPGEMGDNLFAVSLGTGQFVTQISTGEERTCAILGDGSLKCWGSNAHGQLGYGNTEMIGDDPTEMGDNLSAIDLGTGRSAKQVSAGDFHTCALLDDDSIKCWGHNNLGQLGLGHTNKIGDQTGEMGDALPAVDLGTNRSGRQVSAGGFHTCALLDDNSMKCWGMNTFGQLGLGHDNVMGNQDGEMGDALPIVDLGTGRTAKQISAGEFHTCALLDDETIKCWGEGDSGRLGLGHSNNMRNQAGEMGDALPIVDLGTGRKARQVSAGDSHTCALLDNGWVKCWGNAGSGRLGQGSRTIHGDLPIHMGDNLPAVDLGAGRTGEQVSAGGFHTCVLLDDDSMKCWGFGQFGQLGQSSTRNLGDDPLEMGDNLPAIDFGTVASSIATNARIVDGTKLKGRVQVQYGEAWRDICDDSWSNTNAQVVCRQVGLAGGIAMFRLNGSGDFGMDDVACMSGQADVGQCVFRGWGVHDCLSEEAAGVQCHIDAWSSLGNAHISARRGHSAIWDTGSGSMFVFAGHEANFFRYYNDLWRYQNGRWEELSRGPSSRGGHSAIWDPLSRNWGIGRRQ